jgi:nucleoside phosphorylase
MSDNRLAGEGEARDACCESARLTALLIHLAHEDTTLIRVRFDRDGTPVDRAFEPADFAALAEQIWTMLRRASGPMRELGGQLARCNTGSMVTFCGIFEPSYHASAGELAFRVLNNARMDAGYPPIFPAEHHPEGRPSFFDHCRHHPDVFDVVASQGFEEIGKQWEAVRSNLKDTFTPFNAEILIGLIRKEAAQAAAARPAPSVGIVTALPLETAAVLAVFDNPPRIDVPGSGAGRAYWMAELSSPLGGAHKVVIAQADMGNNSAAIRASLLLTHFPAVASLVMCGIAGGVPQPSRPADHVRLGDVVSNLKGIVQYDFVKRTIKGKRGKVWEEVRASSHRPSAVLLEAVRIQEVNKLSGQWPWEPHLLAGLARLTWVRPDPSTDLLADANEPANLLDHPSDDSRRAGQPCIFLGPIASANTLLKDPKKRDALRDRFGAKAVEMEGSGIQDATWNHGVGYLVVRGICDYCDANKNDLWHPYAAMAAAAYVRALLESMPSP